MEELNRHIIVKGAKEHNLKDVSLTIPRNKLVVFTGLSGSGKSSLAFDTIYAEGQRRYLESLSAYARQFMEQMRKPAVDSIEGLSPSISIEQKNISRNPRSTVGTVTEIYDFLRLLYARVGIPHCYSCGKAIQSQTVQQITDQIMELDQGSRFAILAPIVRGKKGEYQKELAELRAQGFVRAKIDGEEFSLSAPIKLKKSFKHDISIYVDRLVLKSGIETRLSEALDIAIKLADGVAEMEVFEGEKIVAHKFFSTQFACPDCGTSFPEIEPRSFSFNSTHGACPDCNGLGMKKFIDPDLVVPDATLTLREGAILPWAGKSKTWTDRAIQALEATYGFSADQPFCHLSDKIQKVILFGSGDEKIEFKVKGKSAHETFSESFPGVVPPLEEELANADEDTYEIDPFIGYRPCESCEGTRLKKEMRFVFVGDKNIAELCRMGIDDTYEYLKKVSLTKHQLLIAEPILKEVFSRLDFLRNVGLSYLTLARTANTLSGGEAQRIRLATQIGSNLVGVLYVLDEPSIGLHQRDNSKLIHTLEQLRDNGNSVIVVEHDEETIEKADFVVDLGPGAGSHGGEIVYIGPPSKMSGTTRSLTGKYMSGTLSIEVPQKRRPQDPNKSIRIVGASKHNLKNLDIDFPIANLICITGVSGSGKSTLVLDTLLTSVKRSLAGKNASLGAEVKELKGLEHIDKVIHVDQSPIGRTPRSNPATYTGVFSEIRALFSELPEAKMRGYKPGRFSFNVEGGRCEACSGDGSIKVSMHFLPDVYVECEVCKGKRYNRETLGIFYKGKSIADVLGMTIEQAAEFFAKVPNLRFKFQTLLDVGLGYVQVGQNAVTLSGGEAQRIKLARELTRRATGRTLYILDEPTTGLHFDDVRKLLSILGSLVDQGNTVVVIEHNLDVIKQADYLIDLGPEGGSGGGEIIGQGTPEAIARIARSYTGQYLKKILKK